MHHVDVESLAPGFVVVLHGERGDIGDQNVDSAQRLRAIGDEFLQRGLVGHVDVRSISVHAFSREILDRGLHLVGVAGADGDARAFLRENIRSGAPDAFGAARSPPRAGPSIRDPCSPPSLQFGGRAFES